MYTILTKIWNYSLTHNVNWLVNPLTQLLKSYWAMSYRILEHTTSIYNKNRMIEFTFDLSKVGYITPWLLGSIFYTILQHPNVRGRFGNARIILLAYYEGDIISIGRHYNLTQSSIPETFTDHFLHLTNKDGHGESKFVLANAQFLIAQVFITTTSIN